MENEIDEQLSAKKKLPHEEAPRHMWTTLLGRALFGFYSEARNKPYFVNDNYLQRLCEVENSIQATYVRLVIYSILFSIFSIATANDSLGEAAWLGFQLASIPYLTEFCVFVLGFAVATVIIVGLDSFAVTRMRINLFSLTGSENPNMRMVHMKGNGAWGDSLIPKTVGYSSNWLHRVFQVFGLIWAFSLPVFIALIVVAAQSICVFSLPNPMQPSLSSALIWPGIFLSIGSISILLIVAFLPIRFSLRS